MFKLLGGLAKKDNILDLPLCSILLENNRFYPWIMLVPRKENVKNMTFLTTDERMQLMKELALCEHTMIELFHPDQINTAAIGNLTQQLHMHVVARKTTDPTWPDTVWNKIAEPYNQIEKNKIISTIREFILQQAENFNINIL